MEERDDVRAGRSRRRAHKGGSKDRCHRCRPTPAIWEQTRRGGTRHHPGNRKGQPEGWLRPRTADPNAISYEKANRGSAKRQQQQGPSDVGRGLWNYRRRRRVLCSESNGLNWSVPSWTTPGQWCRSRRTRSRRWLPRLVWRTSWNIYRRNPRLLAFCFELTKRQAIANNSLKERRS